jgi:hypothetical protein
VVDVPSFPPGEAAELAPQARGTSGFELRREGVWIFNDAGRVVK